MAMSGSVENDAVIIPRCGRRIALPTLVTQAGSQAETRFVEFFTAHIRNANTRRAYGRAIAQFFAWCDGLGIGLGEIAPVTVAAYIEQLPCAKPTVKQHLAAIRMLFDWLVIGQVVASNPASAVRGPKYVVKRGLTPVLTSSEARRLLDSIDTTTIIGLRDRALIAVMAFSFARISATLGMRVSDYYHQSDHGWFRLHEKGGKLHSVPAHPQAECYLNAYLDAAVIAGEKNGPLFRTVDRHRRLTARAMAPVDALKMIKRRARAVSLPETTCNHTFRATGITAYLEGGGTIEGAQAIAAHESPRTTKLYDRRGDRATLEEVQRIAI